MNTLHTVAGGKDAVLGGCSMDELRNIIPSRSQLPRVPWISVDVHRYHHIVAGGTDAARAACLATEKIRASVSSRWKLAKIHCIQWISMEIDACISTDGYLWISFIPSRAAWAARTPPRAAWAALQLMSSEPSYCSDGNFHGYPWISMDIDGYPWISVDTREYPWMSMGVHGYLWRLRGGG